MAFDAFMVIKASGSEVIKGESLDEEFSKQGASEILSFDFTSSEAGSKIQGLIEGVVSARPLRPVSASLSPASAKEAQDVVGRLKKLENEMVKKREKRNDNQPEKVSKLKISLTKHLDSSSTGLLKAYCQASDRKPSNDYKPFESVILSFRKAGGPNPLVYLKMTLSKVDVTSYTLDSGSGGEPPRESLTLSFETFKVSYTSQAATGSASGKSKSLIMGWDYESNKPT